MELSARLSGKYRVGVSASGADAVRSKAEYGREISTAEDGSSGLILKVMVGFRDDRASC